MDDEILADKARRLYAALASGDRAALDDLLHSDFVGRLAAGMPFGIGGAHEGPDAMRRDGYGALGLTCDGGSTYFLPRLIGLRRAQELFLLNRRLTAQEGLWRARPHLRRRQHLFPAAPDRSAPRAGVVSSQPAPDGAGGACLWPGDAARAERQGGAGSLGNRREAGRRSDAGLWRHKAVAETLAVVGNGGTVDGGEGVPRRRQRERRCAGGDRGVRREAAGAVSGEMKRGARQSGSTFAIANPTRRFINQAGFRGRGPPRRESSPCSNSPNPPRSTRA